MSKTITLAITIVLVFYLPAASAQLKLEVIPLQHRTADQIIPVIRPLLSEGGTVTGMNNQLIIKTTPVNLADIKEVLRSLDKAPRRLVITVSQDVDGYRDRSGGSVDGSYSSGDITVTNSSRTPGRTGASIAVQDDDGNTIRLRGTDIHSNLAENNDYRIQTIEGRPAYIQTGQSVPIANQDAFITRDGVVVRDTVEYHDVTSGFYVTPNLSGDNVTLLISPNLSRIHPGQREVFDVQNIRTTVHGRLGEWINLGGVNQASSRQSGSILHKTRWQSRETRNVFIKVEEIGR